jgi:hypothetical protein
MKAVTTLHGIGEGREQCDTRGKWDLSTNTNLPWGGGGSRQRAVENYIVGSQPRVQKGTSSRGGRARSRCKDPGSGVHTETSHGGEGGKNEMNVEVEVDREGSDVSHPRGVRFVREEREGIGGENERK